MGEVEEDFVYPIEQRPKLTIIQDNEIPIIDLSSITSLENIPNINSPDTDPNILDLVTKIRDACVKWGFFQVVNHGVPHETVLNLNRAAEKFFGQSKEEKMKVKRSFKNPLGFSDDEHTGNVKDWKQAYDFTVHDSTLALVLPDAIQLRNQWPQYPSHLRDVAKEYGEEVFKLCMKLLELIALSLGVPANRLTNFFKDDPTVIGRLNRYMACPSPELVLGIGAHKDSGGLTIVSEDGAGGLQVKRKSDGEWISVKPVSGAFVVNIADIIQVWSNDKYESVEHRVVLSPNEDRNSIVFFFSPAYCVNVKPLEELVDEHNPPNYNEFNHGTFRASFWKNILSKPNLGNQISHFKIPK